MAYQSFAHRVRQLATPILKPIRDKSQSAVDVAVEAVVKKAGDLGLANKPVDLVISPNEISFAHGTGVLLSRLLEDQSDFIAIRSTSTYDGKQSITPRSEYVLSNLNASRAQIVGKVHDWVGAETVRSILCVPYFESDLQMAIAAKAITGAPLGIWVMDDNALVTTGINRRILDEAMRAADAVFAISPELRNAYETHTRRKIWLMPPLVAPKLVRPDASPSAEHGRDGVMIGNVWSQSWLNDLDAALKAAGRSVTWYASNAEVPWLSSSDRASPSSAIKFQVAPPQDELVRLVTEAPFVIVPTAKLDGGKDPGEAIGRYSLPTRMPFVMAACGTPMIVVGSPDTGAARFVQRFKLGAVAPYDGKAVADAIDKVSQPAMQASIRERAAALGPSFSFAGAFDTLFETIRSEGRISNRRFEDAFPADEGVFHFFVPEPPSLYTGPDFVDVELFARRLKKLGFYPDFVIDVGASTGIWSLVVSGEFPDARFVLCDPMFSRYEHNWAKPDMKRLEVAVSDKSGTASFKVSGNLYNSSLIKITNIDAVADTVTVPLNTIDSIVASEKLDGRGLLKVDVQFAEHLVVAGAVQALKEKIDVVILELTLARVHPDSKTLLEVSNTMEQLGFRLFDSVGEWRTPETGELEQLDLAFVRNGLAESGFKRVQ